MLRFSRSRLLPLACVLGVSGFTSATGRAGAQTYFPTVVPYPHDPGHAWGFFGRHDPIPRTYSYYYQTWFNQPRHTRVTRPDGSRYWVTTVRGLPLGTPWPSR